MIWEETVFQKEKFSVLRNTAHLTRHWASLFIPLHWKGMVLESSSSPQSHSTPEAPGRLWIPSLSGRWCKATHLGWVQNPLQRHSAHEIPVRTLLCSGAVCPTKEKPSDLQPCRSGATPEHPVQGLWNALPLPLWQRGSELSLEHPLAPLTGQSFSAGWWPRSAGKRRTLFQHKLHLQGLTFTLNKCGGPKPPVGHFGFMCQ